MPLSQSFCDRGLFAYLKSYSVRVRLLIYLTSRERLPSYSETREASRHHGCILSVAQPTSPTSLEGVCVYGSHRTVAKQKQFLTSYSPRVQCRSRQKNPAHSSMEEGYLKYFKGFCLRVQLPVSLHLDAKILPFKTLIELGTPSTMLSNTQKSTQGVKENEI